jgi:hypothetical protein
MTDPQELERVRAIHEQLDRQATLNSGRDFRLHLTKSDVHLVYTAAEIRAWPRLKQRMLSELSRGLHFAFVTATLGVDSYGISVSSEAGLLLLKTRTWNNDHKSAERGLYMTREMLNDSAGGVSERAPAADYDWREADRNETNVLWEATRGGLYSQQITDSEDGKKPLPMIDPRVFVGGHFRAKLGRRGWLCQRESATAFWEECGDYMAREVVAAHTCRTCLAAYKPNDYSSAEQCGYCRSHEQLSSFVDSNGLKAPAALRDRSKKRKPSKHDARAIDLDQAWSTPGWES